MSVRYKIRRIPRHKRAKPAPFLGPTLNDPQFTAEARAFFRMRNVQVILHLNKEQKLYT